MIQVNNYLDKLRKVVSESTVQQTFQGMAQGGLLIDIRERDEVEAGSPLGALRIPKGLLEMQVAKHATDAELPIYLLCASGRRSLVAGHCLAQMGYQTVYSVAGGIKEWKNQGLPIEVPETLSADDFDRYKRHLLIPELGESGQIKLLKSKVLVIGAGGIGSPVAWYLAAAGIGTLGIIDDDIVDRSNLQRQILHTENSIGKAKVASAKKRLEALNPKITINAIEQRLTASNIEDIISQYDLIIDGTDNFTTRYLINDACVKLDIPNVHGSVYRFEGQLSTFWPSSNLENAPCYRCLYPSPPPPELAPSCAEAGVLGVLPGIIGVMCATEAIKILAGFGELMVGKILRFDALNWETDTYEVEANSDCPYCSTKDKTNYPGYQEYEVACAI